MEIISERKRTRSQAAAILVELKSINVQPKKGSKVYEKDGVKNSGKRKRRKGSNVRRKKKGKHVQVDSDEDYVFDKSPKRRKLDYGHKGKSSSLDLKTWDFYVQPRKHFTARIGAHTNVDVVKLLNAKLDDRQIQMFRETCFGHFLDLPDVLVQPQLIHSLLLREVVHEREDELCISVNDVRLRFGLVEFGIITGLKCTGVADVCLDFDGTNRLFDTYFSELCSVPKQSLIDCFLNKRWKSDEDAVNIAILYFIHTFLFSTLNHKYITRHDFGLVESGAYQTYPWGKVVFKATLKSIKGRLLGKPSMYRLRGLPLAFQCWFYECCPYVNKKIAFRVDDKVPRILSWEVTKKPNLKELSNGIFMQKRDQLMLRNISPTTFEQTTLNLPESFENERDNEVASGDGAEVHLSDDDFSGPPPQTSRKQPKTKPDHPLNNDDCSTELKRLSDGQLELKSEIQMLNKEVASLKDCMVASFADAFKAIKSLSKKQREKTASEVMHKLDGENGHHERHGESDSSDFSNSEDNGCQGQEHGKDSMGDKDNSEKGNEVALGDAEGRETVRDPVVEGERMDVSVSQILPDTCEVSDHITLEQSHLTPVLESPYVNQDDTGVEGSSEKSILKGQNPLESKIFDDVDYSLLSEFDKWVDEGMKKESK
uniref:Uncharacterized protein LOC104230494 isoform X1 n=1 Tax=Nicotiana sylvestris TaxID=4096 RepID=A0A1U7X565_NICSY|nr:PREDICTED: uncharacterized protein LOC104230494 isoform X1 [Nicotiana sylvestris]